MTVPLHLKVRTPPGDVRKEEIVLEEKEGSREYSVRSCVIGNGPFRPTLQEISTRQLEVPPERILITVRTSLPLGAL